MGGRGRVALLSTRILNQNKNNLNSVISRWQSTAMESAVTGAGADIKPYSAMPLAPGAWPILGHLPFFTKKETKERMHVAFENLRKEAGGDIFRMSIPGGVDMVCLFRPEDAKAMYSYDSKVPFQPGFELFDSIRKNDLKERYKSAGLLVNTEEWYHVRRLVQQDMMRPKSAFYYIEDLDDIARELADKIAKEKGKSGEDIKDILPLIQAYALEAVGCIFMNARLGAIQGEGDGKRMIELSDITLPLMQEVFFIPPRLHKFFPAYKRLVKCQAESFDLCKKHVDAAMDRITAADDSMIAKLVRACGRESGIPLTMAIDSILAGELQPPPPPSIPAPGIDTTGSTGTSLLHHLATNPEKQELLYQEICQVIRSQTRRSGDLQVIGPSGKMTEVALAKMSYLKACQTESQRMANASFATSRRLQVSHLTKAHFIEDFQEDAVIGGYQIPKGTDVIRIGHSTANDPSSFSDPNSFLPERWLRGCPQRHSAHPFANIPFGHGAR